jgi:hypothetical protein
MARFSCAAPSPRAQGEAARRTTPALFHRHLLAIALLFCAASATAQVQLPELTKATPIAVSAESGNQWQMGSYEVWLLRGACLIRQGNSYARGREAVLWIDRGQATENRQQKVIAYLEGEVEIVQDRRPAAPTRLTDRAWLGRFQSSTDVQVRATATAGKPDVLPPIYWRGMERRAPGAAADGSRPPVAQAQYLAPPPAARPNVLPAPAGAAAAPTAGPTGPGLIPAPVAAAAEPPAAPPQVVHFYSRSDVPLQIQWYPDPASNQWVALIQSGVNVVIDGVPGFGKIDILTDRLVVWMTATQTPDLNRPTVQDQRKPLEFYMEGNIVFREGERTIYADRMYYDVPNHVGTILNADVLTPASGYQGMVRLHAAIVQQTAPDRYLAKDAFLTSSRIGDPTYRFQSNDVYFKDRQTTPTDPVTGLPLVDPTGQPIIEHQRLATASNDFIFLGPVPVFYWPTMATDLNEPTYYIRSARFKQDSVFGNVQILTHWNAYQLLGIQNKPAGTDFDLGVDYLSKRGWGYGTSFHYDREDFFGLPGPTSGLADFWAIQDHGLDQLGSTRMNVEPEASYRYRLFWQHREMLPYDLQLSAEVGAISDRNFLEEYYKNEWDTLKDETTGLELKRVTGNSSWSITADARVNDFFTQTNWLPRADHFWLGQPLFGDALTWYEHSSAGYAQFRQLTVPQNPANDGPFNFLPWEQNNTQGGRFVTRQELDCPVQLGPVKVVPYALGEAAHWDQDIDGNPLDRLFWQAGVRASLPMWSVDPTITSDLLNVHGIAHKVVFNAEFSYARANQNLQNLPLYDPLDDDSVEAFRRMFLTTTFGIPTLSPLPVPPGTPWIPQFDERLYALRTGLQDWVTSPSTEIAGDLTALRLGVQQRWQTKRGPPDDPHIIDWITLDTNATFYPDDTRDNFGEPIGLIDYDFRWHVGDRLTVLSDAIFDVFNEGQKLMSVGVFLNRPPRGSLYAGFRILEGPIDSKVVSLSYSYWMSPKWVSSFGTSVDLAQQGNLGESFTIMRVGESALVSVGFSVDPIRKSAGANVNIQPRFAPKNPLGTVGGAEIPPAGAFGLE